MHLRFSSSSSLSSWASLPTSTCPWLEETLPWEDGESLTRGMVGGGGREESLIARRFSHPLASQGVWDTETLSGGGWRQGRTTADGQRSGEQAGRVWKRMKKSKGGRSGAGWGGGGGVKVGSCNGSGRRAGGRGGGG
eukprot:749661-Hanusia_phi.AAC.1